MTSDCVTFLSFSPVFGTTIQLILAGYTRRIMLLFKFYRLQASARLRPYFELDYFCQITLSRELVVLPGDGWQRRVHQVALLRSWARCGRLRTILPLEGETIYCCLERDQKTPSPRLPPKIWIFWEMRCLIQQHKTRQAIPPSCCSVCFDACTILVMNVLFLVTWVYLTVLLPIFEFDDHWNGGRESRLSSVESVLSPVRARVMQALMVSKLDSVTVTSILNVGCNGKVDVLSCKTSLTAF